MENIFLNDNVHRHCLFRISWLELGSGVRAKSLNMKIHQESDLQASDLRPVLKDSVIPDLETLVHHFL